MEKKIKQFLQHVKRQMDQMFAYRKQCAKEEEVVLEEEKGNCYLPQLREIIEIILEKRKIPYEQFAPVLIDGGDVQDTLLGAELLGRDLNRLTILTDRPAYFTEYTDSMYEENGLIVELSLKDAQKIAELSAEGTGSNVILDFETTGERKGEIKFGKKLYIPVFKKRWERTANLDIAVPIGYNTMIVRVSETVKERPYLDKFERAFYENE